VRRLGRRVSGASSGSTQVPLRRPRWAEPSSRRSGCRSTLASVPGGVYAPPGINSPTDPKGPDSPCSPPAPLTASPWLPVRGSPPSPPGSPSAPCTPLCSTGRLPPPSCSPARRRPPSPSRWPTRRRRSCPPVPIPGPRRRHRRRPARRRGPAPVPDHTDCTAAPAPVAAQAPVAAAPAAVADDGDEQVWVPGPDGYCGSDLAVTCRPHRGSDLPGRQPGRHLPGPRRPSSAPTT
jgi:hypothetical protein